jgi:hypothetical protein
MRLAIKIILLTLLVTTASRGIQTKATQRRASTPNQKSAKSNGQDTENPNSTGPEHVIVDNLPNIGTGKDVWDKRSTVLAGLVVVIGGITFAAIWYQAKEAARAANAAADSVESIHVQTAIIERQTAATEKAAEASNRSVTLMAETAQRQLRAYVCLDSAAVIFPEPAVLDAQIKFKNCGQTPAYDVRGWIHTWFAEYPLKDELPNPPDDMRKGAETLAPGRVSTFISARKPPLPPQCLSVLGTPKFTLYVYGKVVYRDIFGKEQFTNYRLIYGGNDCVRSRPDENGGELWLLNPDSEGNEAT